ncbi:MAG: tetratricopeptide repeat protein [Blastocatellia bacterium]
MRTTRIPLAFALLLLALAQCVSGQTSAPGTTQRKTVAVIVGISKYAKLGGGQQLQFADRDALLIADSLKKAGVSSDNVRVLVGQEATVAAIKSALGTWLARTATADDTVVIFFSGHGLFEQEFGEAYMLGADSDAKDPFATALSLNEINQALNKRVRARRVLLITDAMRRDFFDPDSNSAAAFLQALDQMATARAGLSVIAANSANEFSREGQRWNGQGVFAKHLAAALGTGQFIDHNNDGQLTADELFAVLAPLVAEDTSNKQRIWHSNTPLAEIAVANLQGNATPPAVAKVTPATKQESSAPNSPDAATSSQIRPTAPLTGPAPLAAAKPDQANVKAPAVADKTIARAEPALTSPIATSPAAKSSTVTSAVPSAPANPSPTPAIVTRTTRTAPPLTAVINSTESSNPATVVAATSPSTEATAPPPRPVAALPKVNDVATPDRAASPVSTSAPLPAAAIEAAPSPLILQIEAAITARQLLEPKNASAWDWYQKLASDPSAAADAARLRPALADALVGEGRAIITGSVYADSITDRVDDFRRAGQMLARARSLKGDSPDIAVLEKLSAAQALIALQFYEEAERALAPLQAAKVAAVENAMGLVHQGKLDNFRAERAFKRAIEMEPNWAAPHYNLALLYRSQQNENALAELEQAASLEAKNAVLLVALGDEYFARQQWPRAADSYRKAIVISPNDDGLHTKLGHALYSQGLQTEANREYQRARELRKP